MTVNLEPEVYAVAKALAKAEDCSVSAAVNRLIRRGLEPRGVEAGAGGGAGRPRGRSSFPVSRGAGPVTAEVVRAVEAEEG